MTEATNSYNKLYGDDRLLAFLNQNSDMKATEFLPALKANIVEFVGEAPQFDDITMLMFDYKPKKVGEREIGGLGIFIAKKTMDSISYAYENGENILDMIKKI